MKTILLTNDDGYFSEGLLALKGELSSHYKVYVVAPDSEKSAVSMALTLNRPLRISEVGEMVFSVNGTPSDCVNIAIRKILPQRPDFVISGMNMGENLSEDIFFSGTVGGAFSGYLYDIPSVAVSLISHDRQYGNGRYDFSNGARLTRRIIEKLETVRDLKGVFNVNIPFENNGTIQFTSLGLKRYKPDIVENVDPRGQKYYWIGTGDPTYHGDEGTDVWAIQNGYISLSKLNYDLNPACMDDVLKGIFDED